MKTKILALALAMLTGCGGGGGDGDPTPAPAPAPVAKAEGVYEGTSTSSSGTRAFSLLVLENDEFYAMYGTRTANALLVSGFVQGQGASSNGTFTSSNARDYFGTQPGIPGTVTATYVPNTSLNGTVSSAYGTATIVGTGLVSSQYDYNAPANLSTIAGAWALTALSGSSVSLNIGPTGAFSGSSSGCSFTGTIGPRPTGKNVFDFSVTFGGAPCALPGSTGRGIGLTYIVQNSTRRQLILAGVSADRSTGTALFGTR